MTIKQRPIWLPDTKGFLAIAIVALFSATIFMLMFKQTAADQTIFAVLTTLLGVLAGEVKEVYGYFFGSSASSANKDEAQNRMAEKLADKAVASEPPIVPVVAPVVTPAAPPAPANPYVSPMEPQK